MQISTPTQTLPAQAYVQEGSAADAASPFSGREHSQNTLGFFAKLLETLMGKGKGETAALPEEAATFPAENAGDSGGTEGVLALTGQVEYAGQTFGWSIQTTAPENTTQASPAEDALPGYFSGYAAAGQAADDLVNAYRTAGEKNTAKTQAPLAKNAAAENPAVYQAAPQPELARRKETAGDQGEKSRLNIEVRDLRSAAASQASASAGTNSAAYAAVNADINADLYKGTGFDAIRQLHAENGIAVDLRSSGPMGEAQNARGAGSDFLQSRFLEDALARELRGNLSTDIVKNATLIMRNGDEGTIRLALRPASLGYVKIHLEMTENKIMGRIIVESNEALRAFQKELPVLEKAFKDSGFMEASLDMSLAQDTAQNAYGGGEYGQQQDGDFSPLDPALAAAIAASRYDYALERAGDADELLGTAEAVMPLSPKRKTVNLFI